MSVADVTPDPYEPYAFLPALTWYQTFYLTPPFIPVMVILTLSLLSRTTLRPREIVLIFAVGAPVGFLLWVSLWKLGGTGAGKISLPVGTLAIGGWATWIAGSIASNVSGKRIVGSAMMVATILSLGAMILSRDRGVAPLHLVLMCGVLLETTVMSRARVSSICGLWRVGFRTLWAGIRPKLPNGSSSEDHSLELSLNLGSEESSVFADEDIRSRVIQRTTVEP